MHGLFPAGKLPAEVGDEAQPMCCSILPITPATPNHQAMRKEKTTAGADAPSNEAGTLRGDLCQKHLEPAQAKNLNASIKVTDALPNELPTHLPGMWPPLLRSAKWKAFSR